MPAVRVVELVLFVVTVVPTFHAVVQGVILTRIRMDRATPCTNLGHLLAILSPLHRVPEQIHSRRKISHVNPRGRSLIEVIFPFVVLIFIFLSATVHAVNYDDGEWYAHLQHSGAVILEQYGNLDSVQANDVYHEVGWGSPNVNQ